MTSGIELDRGAKLRLAHNGGEGDCWLITIIIEGITTLTTPHFSGAEEFVPPKKSGSVPWAQDPYESLRQGRSIHHTSPLSLQRRSSFPPLKFPSTPSPMPPTSAAEDS